MPGPQPDEKRIAPPTPARQPSKTPQSFKAISKHKNSLTLDFTNNSMENQDLFTPTGQSRLRRPAHTNSALHPGPLLPQATRPHRRSRRSRRSRPAPNKLSPTSQAAVAAGNQASPRRLIASPGCRLQLRPLDLQAKLLQKTHRLPAPNVRLSEAGMHNRQSSQKPTTMPASFGREVRP